MEKDGKVLNKTKRLAEIKKMVEQQGRIEVNELSEIFGVSEVTIRKDLDVLEERKCLKRIYGAALPVKEVTELSSVQEEYLGIHIEYDSRKEEIGRLAASLVTDTGWLFIGQGTTCYYVARELAKLDKVNVLTNNLLAAQALAKNTQANVILTGGNLVHSHLYVAGEMFMRNLDNLHVSQAFMGVGGADLSAGYTVNYSTELIVYRTIREIADKLVIVLDSLKFDKKTFLSLGRLTLSDTVVSDKGVPQQYIDYYKKNNIEILI